MHELHSINPTEKICRERSEEILLGYHISALLKSGLKQKEIANELGVHPSIISRELKRNKDKIRGYSADLAQIISTNIQMQKKKRFSLTKALEKYIRAKLKLDWSPEQVAGRMKLGTGVSVVHETIYRYIYTNKSNGGKLYTYLRHKNTKPTAVRPCEA